MMQQDAKLNSLLYGLLYFYFKQQQQQQKKNIKLHDFISKII
jgi:hypothetical protein